MVGLMMLQSLATALSTAAPNLCAMTVNPAFGKEQLEAARGAARSRQPAKRLEAYSILCKAGSIVRFPTIHTDGQTFVLPRTSSCAVDMEVVIFCEYERGMLASSTQPLAAFRRPGSAVQSERVLVNLERWSTSMGCGSDANRAIAPPTTSSSPSMAAQVASVSSAGARPEKSSFRSLGGGRVIGGRESMESRETRARPCAGCAIRLASQ